MVRTESAQILEWRRRRGKRHTRAAVVVSSSAGLALLATWHFIESMAPMRVLSPPSLRAQEHRRFACTHIHHLKLHAHAMLTRVLHVRVPCTHRQENVPAACASAYPFSRADLTVPASNSLLRIACIYCRFGFDILDR